MDEASMVLCGSSLYVAMRSYVKGFSDVCKEVEHYLGAVQCRTDRETDGGFA